MAHDHDMMKCIVYGTRDSGPRTQMRPRPPPSNADALHHVLVQVQAVSLNPVDAKEVVGDKLPASWQSAKRWWRNKHLCHKIIGFDFAGIVAEDYHGRNDDYVTGDCVIGTMPPFQGTLAEYVRVPIHQVHRAPTAWTWAQCAALPLVGLTSVQCMKDHDVRSVLVIGGSGGAGHVALSVARAKGADHVTAVCSTRNVDFCRQRGATHVIDYTADNNMVAQLQQAPGGPFTFVLDCVTSADPDDAATGYPALLQNKQHKLLSSNYQYRRLGGPTRDWWRAGVQRTACGGDWVWCGQRERLFWIRFPYSHDELGQLVQWANDGVLLPPYVQETFEFSPAAVQDAFSALLSRRVRGKVVVLVGDAAVRQEQQGDKQR